MYVICILYHCACINQLKPFSRERDGTLWLAAQEMKITVQRIHELVKIDPTLKQEKSDAAKAYLSNKLLNQLVLPSKQQAVQFIDTVRRLDAEARRPRSFIPYPLYARSTSDTQQTGQGCKVSDQVSWRRNDTSQLFSTTLNQLRNYHHLTVSGSRYTVQEIAAAHRAINALNSYRTALHEFNETGEAERCTNIN
jgi:hypothetical protein